MNRRGACLPRLLVIYGLLPGSLFAGHTALAQSAGSPPPPQAAAGVPLQSPLAHILPPAPPPLGAGLPSFQAPGAEGAVPNAVIPVGSVAIIGATAFPAERLATLTAGLAGQTVPLAKIEAARLALLSLYRNHGFILTTISLDIDPAGNVRFIVTEGQIVAVKLSQDIGPAGTMVLGFLNHLTEVKPVSEAALERWLLLAQQIPGISVHAVLQADNNDPGALTLVAEVSKQTVSGLLTADNRGFRETGPSEGLLVVNLNSLTAHGDQTEVSIFHTNAGTDNFGQISESFYLGNSGLQLNLFGGSGRANPSGTLRQVQYESFTTVFGARLNYPLILRRNQALNISLRFDASENAITTGGARTSYDSLRVARAGGQYAWQDDWAGDTRNALSVADFYVSHGIPAFGASPDGRKAPPAGRSNERVDFWKINASFSRTQTLFSPLPGTTISLLTEAGGQYTSQILPSEEQFYLGGNRYTRGFYAGQVTGDTALYATAELQLNTGYDFSVLNRDIDMGAQFYGFYDWGEAWSNLRSDNHVGLNRRIHTYGGGIRLGLTRYLELDGELVHRLTTRFEPAASGIAPLSETAIYWGVTARY